MYSEDSKKKVYYLLSDVVALLVAYKILASFYPYHFFGSNFFGIIFAALLALISVLNDEYSNILNRGYFQEFKASIVWY